MFYLWASIPSPSSAVPACDPEVRYFESGSMVANLTMAVNRRSRDDEPDWFNLEIWGKQAQVAADYVKKGSLLGIIGSFKLDRWTDRASGEERSKPVVRVLIGSSCSAPNATARRPPAASAARRLMRTFPSDAPGLREAPAPVFSRRTDAGARCADPTRSHRRAQPPPATHSPPWRRGRSTVQRCCSPLPSTMPATVSRPVQIKLPAVVQSRNGAIGIISMPAGTEIKVRIPGTRRPQNTRAVP